MTSGEKRRAAVFIVLTVLVVLALARGENESRQRCHAEQANRTALRTIVLRGRDVGKPGTPGYAYYRAHPGEAAKALERVDQALDDLPPIHC